jgi:hypothetical protein
MKTMNKRALTALAVSGAVTLVMGTGCTPRSDTDKATDPERQRERSHETGAAMQSKYS